MAEIRASSFVILLIVVGGLLFVGLTGFGVCAGIGWFNTDWVKGIFSKGASASRGYLPAKTPAEAMDKFRDAIQNRAYDQAAIYTTKAYGDMLKRAHPNASELGASIDSINNYGKNKSYWTDRTRYAFHTLDPFPKNFRTGSAPVEAKGTTFASYTWDAIDYKNANIAADAEWKNLDAKMYQNVLGGPKRRFITGAPIELVKEGEHWKLNIPTDPVWEAEVSYFIDNAKRYHSNLANFDGNMLNDRFTSETYESEITRTLRAAK